jgi:hypothetical protein
MRSSAVHCELAQELGTLILEKTLLPPSGVDPGEDGTEDSGLGSKGLVEIDEAPHGANDPIMALIRRLISSFLAG